MATTRQRETSAEWAATLPDVITAKVAKERLQYAYDYSTDAINAVMSRFHGTMPPPQDFLPGVYDARKAVENGLTAIGALAERAPESHVAENYVKLGRQIGARLIDESNAAMDSSKRSESPAEIVTDVVKVAERAAGNAAKGLIRVGGMLLTPVEALLGAAILDEIFTGGKYRRKLLGGGGGRRRA